MIVIKFWMTCLFLLMSGALLAAAEPGNQGEQKIRLVMTTQTGVQLQLEARQAPLAQVLDSIANKTGVQIHYSVLPDGLVNATCVGPTVKQVLECLLVRKADLVFRYSGETTKAESQGQPAEIWVLGAKFGADQTNSVVCSSVGTRQQILPAAAKTKAEQEPDQTDELVKMASSKIPAERAEAIGRLMAGGREGDATVKETLEAALSDQDARVRVQAVSSLAHREGAGASAALHEAMHDSDVSVRLTAVDNTKDDIALLQQALNDSDETVRQLAGIRLEPLLKTSSSR